LNPKTGQRTKADLDTLHLHKEQRFFAHNIRVKQLKHILERMQEQQHLPVILAGDFNENALMEQKKLATILQ
jgi:endonuclease/exonuclease/phosphatase family metal-dependent hydrolase